MAPGVPQIGVKQALPMLLDGLFTQIKCWCLLLLTIRLPDDYAFDPESGIDTDSDLYRNSLKKAVIGIIKLYPEGYLDFVQHLFATVVPIEHFAVSDWRDAEAVLTLLFYFGDGCNVNLPNQPLRSSHWIVLRRRSFCVTSFRPLSFRNLGKTLSLFHSSRGYGHYLTVPTSLGSSWAHSLWHSLRLHDWSQQQSRESAKPSGDLLESVCISDQGRDRSFPAGDPRCGAGVFLSSFSS